LTPHAAPHTSLREQLRRRAAAIVLFTRAALSLLLISTPASSVFARSEIDSITLPIVVARQPEPARRELVKNLQAIRETFAAAGVVMSAADLDGLGRIGNESDDLALQSMQRVLDHYALLDVNLTDEAWFLLHPAAMSPAGRPLTQGRWATFLVKVRNDSRVTSPLAVRSDQGIYEPADPAGHLSATCQPQEHGWAQWFKFHIVGPPLMQAKLSGMEVEYFVMQICSLDSGDRAAELTFYLGGGLVSQGHYGSLSLLFRPVEAAGQ
jgi:hypothetical protein